MSENLNVSMDIREQVDKIMSYKTVSDNDKIDRLLFINADQYCNLGTDSNKTDRQKAELNSRYIYRAIKNIDVYLGAFLLKANEE